jgi:hypothetical protein
MFGAVGENTLRIYSVANFLTISLVYAFYPEKATRTLEEMDLLCPSKSPLV